MERIETAKSKKERARNIHEERRPEIKEDTCNDRKKRSDIENRGRGESRFEKKREGERERERYNKGTEKGRQCDSLWGRIATLCVRHERKIGTEEIGNRKEILNCG